MKRIATLIAGLGLAAAANAAVIIQDFTLFLGDTEITQPFNVNLFNSSLGTLTDVSITLTGRGVADAQLSNNGSQAHLVQFNSVLNLFLDNATSGLSESAVINLFDFGPSEINVEETVDLGSVDLTTSVTFDPANLSAFVGAGATMFVCESFVSNTQTGGGGDISVMENSQAGCGLQVVYTYDDAQRVPEPASMLLLGLGLAGIAAVRRKANPAVRND